MLALAGELCPATNLRPYASQTRDPTRVGAPSHDIHEAVARNLARQFEKIREGARRASPPISSVAKTLPKKSTGEAGNRGGVQQAVGLAQALVCAPRRACVVNEGLRPCTVQRSKIWSAIFLIRIAGTHVSRRAQRDVWRCGTIGRLFDRPEQREAAECAQGLLHHTFNNPKVANSAVARCLKRLAVGRTPVGAVTFSKLRYSTTTQGPRPMDFGTSLGEGC
jgi:hypothetical protein